MTDKKFLFLNTNNNVEEQASSDTISLGGLTVTSSAGINMGTFKITSLANGTETNDAVNYGQLQSALAGLFWTDPAAVLRVKSDADQSGTPPTAGSTGEAWVVNNWGSGYNNGDIVEWDGDSWVVVVTNSGGEPPNGTRIVVIESGAAGAFSGKEENYADYNSTTNAWTFTAPPDGTALIIYGDGGYYADAGYTYNGTNWVQFSGAGQIIAGDGLDKSGNTLFVKAGDGIKIDNDYVAVDLTSNAGLQLTGTTPDKTLGVKVNTGAGMFVDGSGIAIDLADSNPGLYFDGSGDLDTKLKASSGIAKDADGLYVVANTNAGIVIDGSGVAVDLSDSNPGLEFDLSGDLKVKADGAHGIILGASGVEIEIDDSPDTLDVGESGLKVTGVPSSFKIAGTATNGTYVTAGNIDDLVDGSDATSLHYHASGTVSTSPTAKAHVALLKGDPVYQYTDIDEVDKADADTEAKAANAFGVALTDQGTPGGNVKIVTSGLAMGVLSGATQGNRYYLASGGGLSTSAPGTGKNVVLIGWAKNSTDLWVDTRFLGKRA